MCILWRVLCLRVPDKNQGNLDSVISNGSRSSTRTERPSPFVDPEAFVPPQAASFGFAQPPQNVDDISQSQATTSTGYSESPENTQPQKEEDSTSESPVPPRYPKIEDFGSIEELQNLSPKDLKILLTLYRIDFKGCVEKHELLERATRLWEDTNEQKKEFTDEDANIKRDDPRPNIFEATKIQNSPLVMARSKAHSNKLAVNSNDIYVSLLDTESQASTEYICRICHGGESMDDLLTPCRCRGTIALVHLKCLERWLKESNHSHCELCQHHYQIIRQPKYGVGWSILMYLRHPGSDLKDILLDFLAFALYTPSAVASTYMLMMICESLVKSNIVTNGTFSSHAIAFSAIFGMAAIDFTYSSWLMMTFQKHVENWRDWYRNNAYLKVVLPKIKLRPHKKRKPVKIRAG